ncbi:MAG TPA: SAM-dependent methyltransferase [Solirubrobacteraceae bacterium]|nr:SAM-dependent methyltransferase [Solirubrobacteraceae bacterium]
MTAVEHFEAQYLADPDPWRYRVSAYEQAKYAATLAACGPGPFESALELGGSIGVFSAQLAPRCRRLTTIDYSPTAVRRARAALVQHGRARALLGAIPDDLPEGSFDLVVASETLYYLEAAALVQTLEVLEARTGPGARLVCVHWRRPGPERPLTAAHVHDEVRRQPWLRRLATRSQPEYLLDVLERR